MRLAEYEGYLVNRKSSNTKIAYLATVGKFLTFIDYNPDRLTTDEVARFLSLLSLQKRNVGPRSLNRHASALRSYFKFMRKDLFIDNFSFSHPLPVWLSLDETQKLISACHTEFDTAIIMTLWGAGLRISELIGLEIEDIITAEDGEKALRVFGKGSKERQVPIDKDVVEAIEAYLLTRGFASKKIFSRPIEFIERRVKQLAREAGIRDITPHVLRHTYATQYLDSGGDLTDLRDNLGHTNIAVTSIYTHTSLKGRMQRRPQIIRLKENEKKGDQNEKQARR